MSKANQETPSKSKRRSAQLDFSNLGPLKTTGTVGFTAFRDTEGDGTRRRKARKKSNGNVGTAMQDDSDDDDEDDEEDILGKMQDVDDKDTTHLAPDDSKFSGELAEGVDRMKVSANHNIHVCREHLLTRASLQLKRAHSADTDAPSAAPNSSAAKPAGGLDPSPLDRDASAKATQSGSASPAAAASKVEDPSILGSPMKRHRPSVSGPPERSTASSGLSGLDNVLSATPPTKTTFTAGGSGSTEMEEEEL